ncbi:MAG TPA: hypothetical protein VF801_05955 [Rhodocyclaceae bacterium]
MTYVLTMGFIFALLVAGIAIDKIYHRFARSNPQLGPFRPEGMQDCCNCSAGSGCSDKASCSSAEAPVQFHGR